MNIICLDIDDCIFINDSTYAGEAEDALDLFKDIDILNKDLNTKYSIIDV